MKLTFIGVATTWLDDILAAYPSALFQLKAELKALSYGFKQRREL